MRYETIDSLLRIQDPEMIQPRDLARKCGNLMTRNDERMWRQETKTVKNMKIVVLEIGHAVVALQREISSRRKSFPECAKSDDKR
jgi:hypothetical protein